MFDIIGKMRKEVIVAYLYVLLIFWDFLGGICKNLKDLSNCSQPTSTDLNTGPPEYETGMVGIQL
jgi:hypothetical protein